MTRREIIDELDQLRNPAEDAFGEYSRLSKLIEQAYTVAVADDKAITEEEQCLS